MRYLRRYCFVLLVCAVLLAAFAHPAVHWRALGWSRGEASYRGRPTSYWALRIREYNSSGVQDYDQEKGLFVVYRVIPRNERSWCASITSGGQGLDMEPK